MSDRERIERHGEDLTTHFIHHHATPNPEDGRRGLPPSRQGSWLVGKAEDGDKPTLGS